MPLLVGFGALLIAVLLLDKGLTDASFADILKGKSGQIFKQNEANAASGSSSSGGGGPTVGTAVSAVAGASGAAINPVRAQNLSVERIDQGRDFADTGGTIVAPEAGTVVAEGPVGSGWEGGGYVVEKLVDGTDVYFEEGVSPIKGLLGHTVQQGETLASLIPSFHSGVEAGYAAPTSSPGANYIGGGYTTLAESTTGYTEGEVTSAGKKFAAWLTSLGFG